MMTAPPFLPGNHLLEDPEADHQAVPERAAGGGDVPDAGRDPIHHAIVDVEMAHLAPVAHHQALAEHERGETFADDHTDVRPAGVDGCMKGDE